MPKMKMSVNNKKIFKVKIQMVLNKTIWTEVFKCQSLEINSLVKYGYQILWISLIKYMLICWIVVSLELS